jgi:hypothetical protein
MSCEEEKGCKNFYGCKFYGPHGCADGGDDADTTAMLPSIGENGNWFIGDVDTGVSARGEVGPAGPQGAPGADGATGADGQPGATGPMGLPGATGSKGDKGDTGAQGPKGETGDLNTESLILRPDLWATGKEYTLGNGLYGRRYKGTITEAPNVENKIVLNNLGTAAKLLDHGGWWLSGLSFFNFGDYNGAGTLSRVIIAAINSNYKLGDLILCTTTATNRVSAAYDLWIKYTK